MKELLERTMMIEQDVATQYDAPWEDKVDWFNERTQKHINLVRKAIDMIATAKTEFREFDVNELWQRGQVHDELKYEEPERTPYIELTWQHKFDNYEGYKTPGTIDKEEINNATMHHILNSSHHPEYWNKEEANLDPNDRDKSVKVLDATKMPALDVAEMVADWQAMSWELGTNTARDWFNKQRDVRWHFSDEQVNLIDRLLKVFESR